MLRKLIPLAAVLALVFGCKKKSEEDGGAGGGGDSNAAYTIKVREPQKGDKLLVVSTLKDTTTFTLAGKGEPKTEEESWEYTETILEMPPGARKPTLATREYKTAKATDDGGVLHTLSYSGKTVLIELKGDKYTFTVGGTPLPEADAKRLTREFRRAEKPGKSITQLVLPSGQVKLNERWTVERDAIVEMAAQEEIDIDADASSITGKLTKVYTKDGKQWGTMEFAANMVVKGVAGETKLSGSMSMTLTIDCPIDGSSPASREVSKTNGDIKGTSPQGPIAIKGGDERTEVVTVVK